MLQFNITNFKTYFTIKIYMRKIYFKIFVSIIILLWVIYFIQTYTSVLNEGFTPKINSLYRPYVRNMNQTYETFVNNYGPNVIMTKLKKWNIY
jgi:hypothetical protein